MEPRAPIVAQGLVGNQVVIFTNRRVAIVRYVATPFIYVVEGVSDVNAPISQGSTMTLPDIVVSGRRKSL